jgi:hypothetical protein
MPPVQPVFTSQTCAPCSSSRLAEQPRVDDRRLRQERRAEAGEKVGCGSLTPISVPASLAVKPERNQYIAWSRVQSRDRRQIPNGVGGEEDAPTAGGPARLAGSAFAICSSL